MKNVMIDIKTLGNTPDSIILQVAGVFFDESGLGPFFDFFPSVEEQIDKGRTISASTVMWWGLTVNESGYVPRCLREAEEQRESLQSMFLFISNIRADFFWQCEAFDFPVLENLANSIGIDFSIPFWKRMDFQTLKNLPYNRKRYEHLRKFHPKKHGAIEDAKAQAEIAIELIYR